jgi:hypothetical protein
VDVQCSVWLVDTVEEVLKSPSKEDFVKCFREDENVLMVRGGGNKASRFLEVVVYAEGGRKGFIWLPEGRGGWGWRRFVAELRLLLVPFVSSPEGKHLGVGATASSSGRSFVEVVRATPSFAVASPVR